MRCQVSHGAPRPGGREGEGQAGHLLAGGQGGVGGQVQRDGLRVLGRGGPRLHEGHLRDAHYRYAQ